MVRKIVGCGGSRCEKDKSHLGGPRTEKHVAYPI